MAIYDCFPFFNELELLEIRLRELDGVVDRFVLAEAPVTHAGHPKPLYYADHAGDFKRWRTRITHLVVDDMPAGPDPWARENHQRNVLVRGLNGVTGTDGVIVSDCDEIPSADAVRRWPGDARAFDQIGSYYWINCVGGGWAGSRILPYGDLPRYASLTAIRHTELPLLPGGGWHFSYLGGPARIAQKLESYAHQDLNQSRFKDPRYLAHTMTVGDDLFARAGMRWTLVPLDERFPRAVREDVARFGHLVCEALFHEDWYGTAQLARLAATVERVRDLRGSVVEIGCWEGRSTIALANACYPEPVIAIDSWLGSADEKPDHPTVLLAQQRDVFAQFEANVRALTKGNVVPMKRDCHEALAEWREPIKFVHIDASHEYRSVRRTIEACLPFVVPGGVICGDDFLTADASRADLDGGVERAVRECLPRFEHFDNVWIWQRPPEA